MTRRVEYAAFKKQKKPVGFCVEERGLRGESLSYLATKLRETTMKVD